MGALLGAAALGCDEGGPDDGRGGLRICEGPGDLGVEELLGPIDTIVVVMMENRSFDHYFGALSLLEDQPVDGLRGTESNPDDSGRPIAVGRADNWVVDHDPPHEWESSHRQWNDGANDGFVREYLAEGASDPFPVMSYHDREQLPIIYGLADNYVLCDRWFASVMGPTWPNRMHLHLGTSGGVMSNEAVMNIPSIFDRLDAAGVSNVYYSSNLPFTITYGKNTSVVSVERFFEDAQAGNLPRFCMVEPTLTYLNTIGNDDHPPADPRMGQAFINTIYQALAQSPHWENCLLVITYDEHGGFYDHVAPPTTYDERPEFRQLGFRVPSIIVGPRVRQGCVSSVQLDHVSVASTLTRKFGLEPLNERVTRTNDLSSAIDPNFLSAPRAPVELEPVVVEMAPSWRVAGANYGGQIELARLAEQAGGIGLRLDRRREHDDIMRAVLQWGVRLGAVRIG